MSHPPNSRRPDYLRPFRLVIGGVLLAAGLVILPLPIPAGALLAILGLGLLIRDSEYVRELIRRLRARFPKSSARLSRFAESLPTPLQRLLASTEPGRVD